MAPLHLCPQVVTADGNRGTVEGKANGYYQLRLADRSHRHYRAQQLQVSRHGLVLVVLVLVLLLLLVVVVVLLLLFLLLLLLVVVVLAVSRHGLQLQSLCG